MTKTKYIGLAVGIAVVALAAGSAWIQGTAKSRTTPTSASLITAANASSLTPANVKEYTLTQVTKHGAVSDCWTAINGDVFNLTDWIAQHPGGEEAILSVCGKDGSAAFNDQHGGDRKPERILSSYQIGALIP